MPNNEKIDSISYFDINGNKYKVVTFKDKNTGSKRIEYYKSTDTSDAKENVWLRDSTWIYLSEAGDTIKKVKYKDGIEVK
jgi:antitoxin component YwqK of YwqJK toxin-antitoxin module